MTMSQAGGIFLAIRQVKGFFHLQGKLEYLEDWCLGVLLLHDDAGYVTCEIVVGQDVGSSTSAPGRSLITHQPP